ncbi:MAG: response regulator transcription factor [Holophagales bacterium]|nr:response regulator transcription factor [Holophagales bacterium]
MFREGVRRILETDPQLRVVAEAGTTAELMEALRSHRVDVVLLDISMPGRGGIDGIEAVKSARPNVRVLVLTAHPEDRFALRCMRAGADGYLTKDLTATELLSAVPAVVAGRKYITATLAETLAGALGKSIEKERHEELSNRELQVLCLLAAGRTVTQIGEELHLSVKTVSTYRRRILEKMEMENNAELIRYAVDKGLVQ